MSNSNFSRTFSTDTNFKKDLPGRYNKYHGLFIGFVKDVSDVQRMGRLRVWIPEFGTAPDDESGWFSLSYCSPFAGATNPDELENNEKLYENSQTSYGMWFIPPDINNQVAVMFANGDPARGYWIGCLYQQYMNHMVPGIPAATNYQNDSKDLPVSEYNKRGTGSVDPNKITRPNLKPFTDAVGNQGLIDDEVRGKNTSGARREAPSQVFGFVTPGPEIENKPGHRAGGHQLIYDDKEEYIMFRTRGGSQIRLDDKNGIIYLINSAGTAWVELSESGYIDFYGKESISFRSEKDFNIRADRDINVDAGRNINVRAAKDYQTAPGVLSEGAGAGGDIKIQALNDFDVLSKNNIVLATETADIDLNSSNAVQITSGTNFEVLASGNFVSSSTNFDITVSSNAIIGSSNFEVNASSGSKITGGSNIDIKAGSSLNLEGGTSANLLGASTNVTGSSSLSLSGGSIKSDPPPASYAGGPTSASSAASAGSPGSSPGTADIATAPDKHSKNNVLSEFENSSVSPHKTKRKTEIVQSVAKRFNTLEPCAEHENTGGQELSNLRSLD